MTTQEAVNFYGTKAEIAKALGIDKAAISQWGEFPPLGRQYEIQSLTKGKLKASPKPAAA